MLSLVWKIYEGILVDRFRKVIEGLIESEQGGFRTGRGCVDQIFTLEQIGGKARNKKCSVYWVLLTWRRRMIVSIGRLNGKY